MEFTLSESLKMLQTAVRDFATSKLAPLADKLEQEQEFPMANFKGLVEIGLTGMGIPPEYGGSGGDGVSTVIAMEEIAKACASTCDILEYSFTSYVPNRYIYMEMNINAGSLFLRWSGGEDWWFCNYRS